MFPTTTPTPCAALCHFDMSRLFCSTKQTKQPLIDGGVRAGADDPVPLEDCCLPSPTLNFCHPHQLPRFTMNFMLLNTEEGDKVVAVDSTSSKSSFLYDPDLHAVCPLPSLIVPKIIPISLTVGKSLYVLERFPRPPFDCRTWRWEALTFHQPRCCHYGHWSWLSLEPPPYVYDYPAGHINSYTVVAGSNICISTRDMGTYSFDTRRHKWTKSGDWAMPFSGLAEYVPKHKLWFGMSSSDADGNIFYASDLTTASTLMPPGLYSLWMDITPTMEGNLLGSYAVHLGSAKFCIARLLQVVTPQICKKNSRLL